MKKRYIYPVPVCRLRISILLLISSLPFARPAISRRKVKAHSINTRRHPCTMW